MSTLELSEIMRLGQRLNYEELRQEAVDIIEKQRLKQREVAEMLGVTPSSVSRALNESGSTFCALQIRIIEAFTNGKYKIRQEVEFVVERKDDNEQAGAG